MTYKQAEHRAKRFAKEGNVRLVNSLIGQVQYHEGDRSANELAKQINMDYGKGNKTSRKYF